MKELTLPLSLIVRSNPPLYVKNLRGYKASLFPGTERTGMDGSGVLFYGKDPLGTDSS